MALTAEQRKTIDEAIAPLKVEAMRTDPIDRDACIAAFNAAYAAKGLPPPEYEFFTNPLLALQKVDTLADRRKFVGTLGEEASLYDRDFDYPAYGDPLREPVFERLQKALTDFRDLYNVVNSGVEKANGKNAFNSMISRGSYSFWGNLEEYGRAKAFSALGMIEVPKPYELNQLALATCGSAFAFERYCFISERPESFHHPAFTKDEPRKRIIVKWGDGFVCEKELWY